MKTSSQNQLASQKPLSLHAQAIVHDTVSSGSPKNVRLSFQQYEDLRVSERDKTFTKFAAGCACAASVLCFVPFHVASTKTPKAFLSTTAETSFGSDLAPVMGAFIGVVGVALTAYAICLGRNNVQMFVKKMDLEMHERFHGSFEFFPERAANWMSRYSYLNDRERQRVREELFVAYLNNPRPIRNKAARGDESADVALRH